MTEQRFEKLLTANDTGHSKSHQAGIHVPKTQTDLIAFLPPLDAGELNPSVWLEAIDAEGNPWRLRYIHYNNRLHSPGGTRNEYRITHFTACLRAAGAEPGDTLVIAGTPGSGRIRIEVHRQAAAQPEARIVRLQGWRRVH